MLELIFFFFLELYSFFFLDDSPTLHIFVVGKIKFRKVSNKRKLLAVDFTKIVKYRCTYKYQYPWAQIKPTSKNQTRNQGIILVIFESTGLYVIEGGGKVCSPLFVWPNSENRPTKFKFKKTRKKNFFKESLWEPLFCGGAPKIFRPWTPPPPTPIKRGFFISWSGGYITKRLKIWFCLFNKKVIGRCPQQFFTSWAKLLMLRKNVFWTFGWWWQ